VLIEHDGARSHGAHRSPVPSIPPVASTLPRQPSIVPTRLTLNIARSGCKKTEAAHAFAMRAMAGHTKDAAQ